MQRIRTKAEVFVIESLTLEDEESNLQEGHIISKMLHLTGKEKTKYYYIRTRHELEAVIKIFGKLKYRYLHISCHAGKSKFDTTLDAISYSDLGNMLRPHLQGRRVFVSACRMVNKKLAEELFRDSELLSLTGPKNNIRFDSAAAFWLSLYHLMFKKDTKNMNSKKLRNTLRKLSIIYDERINHFAKLKGNSQYKLYHF